jgi:signal transduction histidine kinase
MAAHDLENALGAIRLLALTLLQGDDPGASGTVRIARTILDGTDQMVRLIDDMRDAGRMGPGLFSVDVSAVVSPAALISAAVDAARPTAANHVLRTRAARSVPAVRADRGRVLQVLANLIGNAIKFTPAGGTITVGAALVEHGKEVSFFVSDTGEGISEADQRRVFDPDRRANRSDRRGSGLGLMICRVIVHAHGGRIAVSSRPGHGSRFSFTLPTANSAAPPGAGEGRPASAAGTKVQGG